MPRSDPEAITTKANKRLRWGPAAGSKARWQLRLYIADAMGRSATALANVKKLCRERLAGECEVEVVDLFREPARARTDGIIALPTLERRGPGPMRRVIGDLSNLKRVLTSLELKER